MSRQGGGTRWLAAALPLLCLIVVAALLPLRVEAHAFLERSDPDANAVLPEQPAEVRLWFTEPLEPEFSRAELYDAEGNLVETEGSRIGDANQLILPLPDGLENGTYTVQWRNISAADGHPQQGYVPFTIGSQADVVVPAAPEEAEFDAPPRWLDALGRWLSLLGAVGATGAIVCWLTVIRQAREPLDDERYESVRDRVSWLIIIAVGVGLLGSLIALGVQAAATGEGLSPSVFLTVLSETRFGHLWLARIVLLFGLVIIATSEGLWDEPPSRALTIAAVTLSAAVMLPFALNSHASGIELGRAAAVAADWLHLLGTSVWIGGLLALLVAVIGGARGVAENERRESLAIAANRFTTLAIASIIILTLTGLYSAWLHVGNLIGLRETDYGQALMIKLILIVPILILGLINMRVLGPRLRSAARTGKRFSRTVATEAALGVVVLLVVGVLTALPTARETLEDEAGNTTFHLFDNNAHLVLYVSPGAVGINRYTVDIDLQDEEIPADAEVLLRMQNTSEIEGEREVRLERVNDERFEATGSELSVVGDWELELIFRRPNEADMRFIQPISIARTPPQERVPGQPPVFTGVTAPIAVGLIALAIVVSVVALRAPGGREDRLAGVGASSMLLLAGALLLVVARDTPTPTALAANPIPKTAESVALGRQIFLDNCAACHGETAEGNGPAAANLERQPANLTEAHVEAHTDGDLRWWIENGIPPSMPAFDEELTEEEIWHVINYIRSLRDPVQAETP